MLSGSAAANKISRGYQGMCLQRWEGLSTLGLDGENKLPGTLCQGDASKTEDGGGGGGGVGGGCARHISLPSGKSSHAQSCPILCDPMDCSPQAPLSMGFSRQEHWSGLSRPPPGDLPNPGILLFCLLYWWPDSLSLSPQGSHQGSPLGNGSSRVSWAS